MRVTFDKPPIEVNESQKDLYVIDILGSWLVLNRFDPIRVYLDPFPAYNEAQEVHLQP